MTFEFALYGNVYDTTTLFEAALLRAEADGLSDEDAREILQPDGEIDIYGCLRMLLDPGSLAGCEIFDSFVEVTQSLSNQETKDANP